MKENLILDKSYQFALRIIDLYKFLTNSKREYVLSRQILRSGTSIGANIEEAIGGQTKKDFFAKFSIAYKEARETRYWLNLLHDSGYFEGNSNIYQPILNDCEEICRIIGKIQITTKQKINNS